jgi:hypothetical protein
MRALGYGARDGEYERLDGILVHPREREPLL